MEALEAEHCLDRMAARLRRWRHDSSLTLAQLAERSGVAASTIHKIELRKAIPTVSVLFRIAQGLDRPITDFLDEEPEPAARLQRGQEPGTEVEPGLRVAPLGDPERAARGWRVLLAVREKPATLRAEGDVLVVCEAGALELLRPSARWRLEPGDVLSLRAPAPFHLQVRSDEASRFLLIGRVPTSPRALLDREAARTRPPPPLASSARPG